MAYLLGLPELKFPLVSYSATSQTGVIFEIGITFNRFLWFEGPFDGFSHFEMKVPIYLRSLQELPRLCIRDLLTNFISDCFNRIDDGAVFICVEIFD